MHKKTKSNWHFKGAFCRSLCMWEGQSPFKAMELGSSQKYKMLEATRKIRAVPDYLRTSAIFKDPPSLLRPKNAPVRKRDKKNCWSRKFSLCFSIQKVNKQGLLFVFVFATALIDEIVTHLGVSRNLNTKIRKCLGTMYFWTFGTPHSIVYVMTHRWKVWFLKVST